MHPMLPTLRPLPDASARRGDAAGASTIARQYLERYPSGLRVHEAKQLITPSGTGLNESRRVE